MFGYNHVFLGPTKDSFSKFYVVEGYATKRKIAVVAKHLLDDLLEYGVDDIKNGKCFINREITPKWIDEHGVDFVIDDIAKTIKARAYRNIKENDDGTYTMGNVVVTPENIVRIKA
jgi:hypothetical protein